MKNWDLTPLPSKEDIRETDKIIENKVKNHQKITALLLTKDKLGWNPRYLLSLKIGEINESDPNIFKTEFLTMSEMSGTMLTWYDIHGDGVDLRLNQSRPLKIKEMFYRLKNKEDIKQNGQNVCRACGNLNRDPANYCDKCGKKLHTEKHDSK